MDDAGNCTMFNDGAVTWEFDADIEDGTIRTLWVRGVHWPGCDDETPHPKQPLGVAASFGPFRITNHGLWAEAGVDLAPVLDAIIRVLGTGDLADVHTGGDGQRGEGEVD